jgi:hypothetical protein
MDSTPPELSYSPPPQHGVLWVLRGGVLLLVTLAAGLHAALFLAVVSAGEQLQTIAEEAALEATLPKASRSTVEQLAIRRLARIGIPIGSEAVYLEQNGQAARRWHCARSGDEFAVSITVPTATWLPRPISRWCDWVGPRNLRVRAERVVAAR